MSSTSTPPAPPHSSTYRAASGRQLPASRSGICIAKLRADPDSAAHRVAADHKDQLATYLQALTGDAGRARDLLLLVDGALVTSLRDPGAIGRARALAERLFS